MPNFIFFAQCLFFLSFLSVAALSAFPHTDPYNTNFADSIDRFNSPERLSNSSVGDLQRFELPPVGRPYGKNLTAAKQIDFSDWSQDLERQEYHPIIQLQSPYWESHTKEHEQKLNIFAQIWADPFKWLDPSFELRLLYLYASNWDQLLAIQKDVAAHQSEQRFSTHGLAFEGLSRFHALNYDFRLSWLSFHRQHELNAPICLDGYNLSFGGLVTEISGRSRSKLDLVSLTNERIMEKKEFSRSTLQSGISYLNTYRLERLFGEDTQAINPFFSALSGIAGDRIIMEQGEELIEKSGLGLFLGFSYHSTLGKGLNWVSSLGTHAINSQTKQHVLRHRVAKSGVVENYSTVNSHTKPEFICDFNFRIQKYMREFYNVSLGFRYLQFQEAQDRVALNQEERRDFALRGVEIALQRFF